MTLWKWSQTAATNSTSDATINWAEGQAPGSVNDSARAMMAAIAKWRDDLQGVKPSNVVLEVAGTTSAYTLTSNQGLTSLTNGFTVTFRVGSGLTNAAGLTLNVDSLGAKNVRTVSAAAIEAGVLVAGSLYTATYYQPTDEWIVHGVFKDPSTVPVGTINAFAGSTAPSGYLLCFGQCISRTTYADLFAVLGTTFNNGCSVSDFGIPDLRGRVAVGKDDMGGTAANRITSGGAGITGTSLGASGGGETQTLTAAQMPIHDHGGATGSAGAKSVNITAPTNNAQVAAGVTAQIANIVTATTYNTADAHTHSIASAGGGQPHSVTQPSIVLNAIIKY